MVDISADLPQREERHQHEKHDCTDEKYFLDYFEGDLLARDGPEFDMDQ